MKKKISEANTEKIFREFYGAGTFIEKVLFQVNMALKARIRILTKRDIQIFFMNQMIVNL